MNFLWLLISICWYNFVSFCIGKYFKIIVIDKMLDILSLNPDRQTLKYCPYGGQAGSILRTKRIVANAS